MKPTVLITGGSGFIGRALALALEAHAMVVRTSRSDGDFRGDLADAGFVRELLARTRPDQIVHLAGATTHHEITTERTRSLQWGMAALDHLLLHWIPPHPERAVFLFASSGKVYSPSPDPLTETSADHPTTLLGTMKRILEERVRFASIGADGVRYRIARVFNVYGPGQRKQFVVPAILHQLRISSTIELGELHHQRDPIFIDDLVTGLETILRTSNPGSFDIYNVGSSQGADVSDMLRVLEDLLGYRIDVRSNPARKRQYEATSELSNSDKLRAAGWLPRYDLRRGLIATLKGTEGPWQASLPS